MSAGAHRRELPCQAQPERWFAEEQRCEAMMGCLACPVRQWCAQEALRVRATCGMWAGVWLDDDTGSARVHLAALAGTPPARHSVARTTPGACRPQPAAPPPPPSIAATVTARSSGCCEIMGPQCRLTATELASRVTGVAGRDCTSPATAYAVCSTCRRDLAKADPTMLQTAGYAIAAAHAAPTTAFLWRHTRWVFLTDDGSLRPTREPAPQATDSVCCFTAVKQHTGTSRTRPRTELRPVSG